MRKEDAIQTINVMQSSYAHIRHSDAEWEALEMAKEAIKSSECLHDTQRMVPLNPEQLKEMDGDPVWVQVKDDFKQEHFIESQWGIVEPKYGMVRLFDGKTVYFSSAGDGWTPYIYSCVRIDIDEWTAEWSEYTGADAGFHYCSKCNQQAFNYEDGGEVVEVLSDFCPSCGRATTKNGIDTLKKRMEVSR